MDMLWQVFGSFDFLLCQHYIENKLWCITIYYEVLYWQMMWTERGINVVSIYFSPEGTCHFAKTLVVRGWPNLSFPLFTSMSFFFGIKDKTYKKFEKARKLAIKKKAKFSNRTLFMTSHTHTHWHNHTHAQNIHAGHTQHSWLQLTADTLLSRPNPNYSLNNLVWPCPHVCMCVCVCVCRCV